MKRSLIVQISKIVFGICISLVAGANGVGLDGNPEGLGGARNVATNGYCSSEEQLAAYSTHTLQHASVTITTVTGQKMRITSYGNQIVRVQVARNGEAFFSDDRYEIVANHTLGSSITVQESTDSMIVRPEGGGGITVIVRKNPLRLTFRDQAGNDFLSDKDGIVWSGSKITAQFKYDSNEHFCGLGYGPYGRVASLDLKGQKISRNYGHQATMCVPFYMTSKGYGLFLNSTFSNTFSFGNESFYSVGIDDKGKGGRMDYFIFGGGNFGRNIDLYTALTGRPRFPQKSMFGLQLSDKYVPQNEGEGWWKKQITALRDSGFPVDVVVNDNRWRAGTGSWSGSWFEFHQTRYPDPARYKRWCDSMGLTVSLDHNRNNNSLCPGWNNSFNIPNTSGMQYPQSVPDYSSQAVRDWQWGLFWSKAFDPALKYPGDAIWMDETDELDPIPDSTTCANGMSWAELENYYPFLIAKAVGQQGWDVHIGSAKRPYIWNRCAFAGMQRYALTWTGDISPTWEEMKMQIRSMLTSGLSGFPYFNHDAGAFHEGVNDAIYRQWSMAMGSFSPIWRPHGKGESRWPIDRNASCQSTARVYAELRYTLMPYIYSIAHNAHTTGIPMCRPMIFYYPDNSTAWTKDLQYFWGDYFLVAPVCAEKDANFPFWLPPGSWYDYWNDSMYTGDRTINYNAATGVLPLFVRPGAVIPRAPYAKSTYFISKDTLIVDVYTGDDGAFALHDDDGVTEHFRKGEYSTTQLQYSDNNMRFTIGAVAGTFAGAPQKRSYLVRFHGLSSDMQLTCNGEKLGKCTSLLMLKQAGKGQFWDGSKKLLHVAAGQHKVSDPVQITKDGNTGGVKQNQQRLLQKPEIELNNMNQPTLRIQGVAADEDVAIELTNLQGTVVFLRQLRNQRQVSLPSQLASGVYIVHLVSANVDYKQKLELKK